MIKKYKQILIDKRLNTYFICEGDNNYNIKKEIVNPSKTAGFARPVRTDANSRLSCAIAFSIFSSPNKNNSSKASDIIFSPFI